MFSLHYFCPFPPNSLHGGLRCMVGAGRRAHVIFWGFREGVIDHTASLFCPLFLLGHVLKAMVVNLVFWLLSPLSGSRGPSWPTQPQPGFLGC